MKLIVFTEKGKDCGVAQERWRRQSWHCVEMSFCILSVLTINQWSDPLIPTVPAGIHYRQDNGRVFSALLLLLLSVPHH